MTAVKTFIGSLQSWLVPLSSSDPELISPKGCEQVSMSSPSGESVLQERGMVSKSRNIHWSRGWFKFVMPNSLNVSG